jgi:hypothetical protein
MSLTYAGVYVMVIGTVLVHVLGISDACSNELAAKVVDYVPAVIGGLMSAIGRYRLGGVSFAGIRQRGY